VRGPLVWIAFVVFFGGSLYKLISIFALAKKEKSVIPTMSVKFGLRSVVHWLIPFASRNMRMRWVVTIASFAFHYCLLITPLFVMGHAVLWQESWGISWWSLSAGAADAMTIVVIVAFTILFLRRVASPEVRNVTRARDYFLMIIVILPFATGFVAHRQWLPHEATLIIHIISGSLWLIAIPFTWLAHMMWFLFSRAYMGSEFGAVRNARDW
jgi:nitrate reductase gamma subunit